MVCQIHLLTFITSLSSSCHLSPEVAIRPLSTRIDKMQQSITLALLAFGATLPTFTVAAFNESSMYGCPSRIEGNEVAHIMFTVPWLLDVCGVKPRYDTYFGPGQ